MWVYFSLFQFEMFSPQKQANGRGKEENSLVTVIDNTYLDATLCQGYLKNVKCNGPRAAV